ncbi:MAG: UbiH/UbiF family hydroxylase [Rhodobacteraceae bacterium]|nr:UbiH/UbiF family hydroxylase [Paracoccaceae bacterium]
MMRLPCDILIAGGGIAGLSAACAFASAGFETICVDPVPPITDSTTKGADLRSTAFLLPSIELLGEIGLWSHLEPEAAPLSIMRILDAGGEAGTIREQADFLAADIGLKAFGYNLPNTKLRQIMLDFLARFDNFRLITPDSVTHVTPRSSGALVQLESGMQLSATLVIAADGRNSPLREALGIKIKTWRYGQKAIVFNVSHTKPHQNISTEIHRSGGPFTLVPLTDPYKSAVVWMERGPRAATLFEMNDTDFNKALSTRACNTLGSIEIIGKRAIWPIIAQRAARLNGPRTALLAEAAHVIPPIGAQGLNMSLADLKTLKSLVIAARHQNQDIGSPAMLESYHRRRWPDMAARITGVDLLNRASMASAPFLKDLRRTGLKTLHSIKPLRNTLMKHGLGAK